MNKLSKDISMVTILKIFNILNKIKKEKNVDYLKVFINEYFSINEEMPDNFYQLVLNKICEDKYLDILKVIFNKDIYLLISYIKYNNEEVLQLDETITPLEYYNIPKRHINIIIDSLKKLELIKESYLDELLKEEPIWKLRKNPNYTDLEYRSIAYKMYISIGLDNTLEMLSNKYGKIDYEKIYFLFSNLDTKKTHSLQEYEVFNELLFNNKKDFDNTTRQMLSGNFNELFLNFDYLYNNLNYFINKIGTKLPKTKLKLLLKERYISENVIFPQITGDILEDMVSSYQCKYNFLNTSEDEIYNKNFEIYEKYLKEKCKSSIPKIELKNKEPFICEILNLNDPRNLVLGYRAGNCFRINGDAAILFSNFLKSEHMRLISISSLENKDFAMMLVMRNGNVLIGQGIEVSKWAPSNIKGKKLYDVCREILKEMMEYMNSKGDSIVATIIGNTNSNVSEYNNQILPFLINPILENSNNYYNGICNYQCLLDLSQGKSLKDIKLEIPSFRYIDKRNQILRRTKNMPVDKNYMEIEKKLISLRYMRMKKEGNFDFYNKLIGLDEVYTCCNDDWYITLYDDGIVDSFISSYNELIKKEYNEELQNIEKKYLNIKMKNKIK